jgi:ferrous iron transport protein B
MHTKKTLADMRAGQQCILLKIHGHGGLRHRLLELGFIRGEKIRVVKNAPLTDPIEYEVMNNHVSLRRAEAKLIEAIEIEDVVGSTTDLQLRNAYAVASESEEQREEEIRKTNQYILEESHTIRVALVGNPNCGKTSFFNHAAGQQEKVGNYSGVTVESKVGEFHYKGYNIVLTDLPGTYSLTAYTPEERYVRNYLKEQQPDIVLNIVDASNLERNLFLTTQLIDMNLPMMMALNMYDELKKSDSVLDIEQLSRLLGFPIIPTVSTNGTGIENILDTLINMFEGKPGLTHHIHIHYGDDIEEAIQEIKKTIHSESFAYRYQALKLLEGDEVTLSELHDQENEEKIIQVATRWRTKLEQSEDQHISDILSQSKYSFIRGALKEVFTMGENGINDKAYKLDKWLTNRWLGFPILIIFLWIMFETTFTLGAYPQAWIEAGIEWLSDTISTYMPEGILHDMLIDGVIAGVGGVIVFLPNILILFFFISLLEDTGYMARAAFIMDRLMHKMGLHGKSFIPYIIGFGCGVPAIMATRTLAGKKDRIITMLTIPFMSCSARLPVYLLFVGAFFTAYQGVILLGIYLTGIVVAILTSILLRKTLFANETDQFVMELPPYRFPTLRNTALHMWNKAEQYLKKMGTFILGASILIWALGYFPRTEDVEQLEESGAATEVITEAKAEQSEQSYIGKLGHFIEPAVRPLGFDWKMGVSILTGAAAKEIIVSSMGILYQESGDVEEDSEGLQQKLRTQSAITPLIAVAFMVFILLYFPCIAAVTAIAKESGVKWAVFSLVYNTLVAWIAAWLVIHIGGLFF